MSTEINSGTLTADGSVQSLGAPTIAGVYRVLVDLANMESSDKVTLIGKLKVLSGGTVRNTFSKEFTDAQAFPLIHSLYVVAPQGCEFTLEQTAGVNRTYPFWVDKLADVTVEASGTKALDGTAQVLTTASDNDEYVLLTDHALQVGGDTVFLFLLASVLLGGTVQVLEQVIISGAQSDPDIILQSVPLASPHAISVQITLTAGVNHNVPWALCRLT